MTYREYLTATLRKFFVSPEDVKILMLNQGIDPDETVDIPTAKRAMYHEFSMLLPLANVSEGGFSVSWDKDMVAVWYSLLAAELDEPDVMNPGSSITNITDIW